MTQVIDNKKLYFWNLIEITVNKSLDADENCCIFGIHIVTEDKIKKSDLDRIYHNIMNDIDYVGLVTKVTNNDYENVELVDGTDFHADFSKWSHKSIAAKDSISGDYLNNQDFTPAIEFLAKDENGNFCLYVEEVAA